MKKDLLIKMQSQFDQLAQTHPEELHLEFWFARDLQGPFGYARWENFLTAIHRAIESCKTTGYDPEHHFRGVTKLIAQGIGRAFSPREFISTGFLGRCPRLVWRRAVGPETQTAPTVRFHTSLGQRPRYATHTRIEG